MYFVEEVEKQSLPKSYLNLYPAFITFGSFVILNKVYKIHLSFSGKGFLPILVNLVKDS